MICPNCGTRLPEGSTRCHFCGFSLVARPTSGEMAVVILMLSVVTIAVWFLLLVVTSSLDIDIRLRVTGCFVIGVLAAWGYWKVSQWINPRLARFS